MSFSKFDPHQCCLHAWTITKLNQDAKPSPEVIS